MQYLSAAEFKASALGAYERGDRPLSVDRLLRLSALYGVDAASVLSAEPETGPQPDIDLIAAHKDDLEIMGRTRRRSSRSRRSNAFPRTYEGSAGGAPGADPRSVLRPELIEVLVGSEAVELEVLLGLVGIHDEAGAPVSGGAGAVADRPSLGGQRCVAPAPGSGVESCALVVSPEGDRHRRFGQNALMLINRLLAPVLDLACLCLFVVAGGRRHDDLNEGFGVVPGGALADRRRLGRVRAGDAPLRARRRRDVGRLFVTLVGGLVISSSSGARFRTGPGSASSPPSPSGSSGSPRSAGAGSRCSCVVRPAPAR